MVYVNQLNDYTFFNNKKMSISRDLKLNVVNCKKLTINDNSLPTDPNENEIMIFNNKKIKFDKYMSILLGFKNEAGKLN